MPRLVPRDSGDCLGSILAARRKEGLSTEEVERKIGIDRRGDWQKKAAHKVIA